MSTSIDKTARIANSDGSGTPVVLLGATGPVRHAAWSPNGEFVAVVSDDKRVRIHRADGLGEAKVFSGHEDAVVFVAWSPDGKQIVTTSLDHSARVWNVDGSDKPLELKGHEAPVVFAAWSADGQRIVTTSEDGYAQVFGAKNGATSAMFGHERAVVTAAWSPNGQRIATATQTTGLYLWDADGNGEPIVLETSAPILAMLFVTDDQILTVAADDTTRLYTIGVHALKKGLASTNLDCLPIDKRVTYLGETDEKASERHTECERSHGRIHSGEKVPAP